MDNLPDTIFVNDVMYELRVFMKLTEMNGGDNKRRN